MSRTVCSWCKAPLVLKDDILVCSNTDCPACDEKYLHEELIRTRKALELAIDAINKASDALIGCQEADNKYISDITAEDGLELLGKALGKIRLLQKDVKTQEKT